MTLNTKTLFAALVKNAEADCLCDIGSCDGAQSLLLRHLRPGAHVLTFEANPLNYKAIKENPRIQSEGIEVFPWAVADKRGVMDFYITDVDYSNPEENRGTSTLFARPADKIKEIVKVETHRIDEVIGEKHAEVKRICLWIDAEGAEYYIMQGAAGIAQRLYALHVETALKPMVPNHRLLPELESLLKGYGLVLCGTNIGKNRTWGDVVFVREDWKEQLGFRFTIAKWKAIASYWLKVDHIAVFLKGRMPFLYHPLRRLYLKFT